MTKLFVIFGATGQQGGSLLNYMLSHPEFSKAYKFRAITRDASKPAADKLRKKGVEVVQADMDKPETLSAAVFSAYGVFSVTNYWESRDATMEVTQGKGVADAARAAGVSLFIWSSLPNVTKFSNGELTTVHHFDSKAEVEDHIRTLSFPSCVFIMTAFFMQNISSPIIAPPKVLDKGTVLYNFAWNSSDRIPYIDITDIGKYLAPALRDPAKYNNVRLTAAAAYYSAQELVDTLSEVSGKKVLLPTEAEIPLLTDDPMKQMLARPTALFTKWGYYGPTGDQDLEWTLAQMDEKPKTLRQFLEDNGPWFE